MPLCERCAECAKTEPGRARKVLFGWGNVVRDRRQGYPPKLSHIQCDGRTLLARY